MVAMPLLDDDYHLMTMHSTWLNCMKRSGVEIKKPEKGALMPSHGIGRVLGKGHAVIDNLNFRGRPVAKWIPLYGEAARPEIDRIHAELFARLGDARGMAKEGAQLNTGERHLRAFWLQWAALMGGGV